MADASHLERMGRELNCPICLSLLGSAVSLSCNHVFCNSCIEKSMKSASNCPVCKVPYRRREIRPAPHMDNLVSVYRSMEVAMGVNIFITQTATSTKISAKDNQTGANTCVLQDEGQSQSEALDCLSQELRPRKRSGRQATNDQGDFGAAFGKPSFPTKKRVQVPLRSTTEVQRQPGMLEEGIDEIGKENPEGYSLAEKNMPAVCKGHPAFTPFFWLREEEDIEKSTQQSNEDQLIGTPLDAPCFSDIKDSDDETGHCNRADFIDSEMFDWTQRPCSPELCLSPVIMQIEDNMEHSRCQEEAEAIDATTSGTKMNMKRRKGLDKTKKSGKDAQNESGTANKTVDMLTETKGSKRNKKTMHEVDATYLKRKKVDGESILKSGQTSFSLNTRRISGKNKKVVCSDVIVQEVADKVSTLLNETEPLLKRNKTAFNDALVSKHHQQNRKLKSVEGNKISKKSGQLQKLGGRIIRTQKAETGNSLKDEGPCSERLISKTDANFSRVGDKKEVAGQGMPNKTCEESCNKRLKSSKKVKFLEGASNNNCSITPESFDEESAMRGQYFQENQCNTYQPGVEIVPEISKTLPTPNMTPLKKCKMLSHKIHCSFCQSSDDSEASGDMVKYCNGKLVTDNQTASSKIIHVHKHCTEWAPDVYFEGDDVINLEAELSRSHRIRCCCCGIKGAALGCYEKTCRKSFHVPCARLTPECRWDYENFVMLCPLHAFHQLPNEEPESQAKQRRKIRNSSLSNVHPPNITSKCESSTIIPWKFEKKLKNLFLCCSAITSVEKGIVSELKKLSGVTVLKNWDVSVTHVIASTDKNGACRRTLKVLTGVLEGKWILNIDWIKACLNAKEFVEEQQYEITCDIHGIRDGPRIGRLRLLNKQPKLFSGCKFYFMGDFAPSYKGYLHDLVISAGGKVLNRKPVGGDHSIPPLEYCAETYIVYSQELPENCKSSGHNSILKRRLSDAKALASSTGAIVAGNSWILNSIAGHKLQNLE
ncbi:protein BREAST CANCER SUSCEPTIBILITY 1 homolog isoform X2 [Henckelia pumila]|uniref:protein BREAST CANCER SUSCEPTIBILITY 1 homolog isoform X2 n=1 Tax=Henckelia pumila TaxID=405737 RepID=UPI003C6E63C2